MSMSILAGDTSQRKQFITVKDMREYLQRPHSHEELSDYLVAVSSFFYANVDRMTFGEEVAFRRYAGELERKVASGGAA